MSWSLEISDGDLSFGSKGLGTVTGAAKLVQDLTCATLEPQGTDPLHPEFGSVLDGGINTQGDVITGIIGALNDAAAADFVATEMKRICNVYQAQQIARNQADVAIYGKSTLVAEEALLSVGQIMTQAVETNLLVTVALNTGSGLLPLNVPLNGS